MNDKTLVDVVTTIFQSAVLIFVIVRTLQLMRCVKSFFLPIFFVLSMSSYLLSNLYWIAYDLLKPDTRMPIAANEIGECAMVLLLCAGLESVLHDKNKIAGEVLFAFLYTSLNIALWIVWSGEWFQDILFGIPYIYFMWILIRGLRSRGILSPKELRFAAAMCIFVSTMLLSLQFVHGFIHELNKMLNYIAAFTLIAWLGFKSLRSRNFFVSTTLFLWTNLVMFSSLDQYYYMALFANTVALPIMFYSMKKELAVNGLR